MPLSPRNANTMWMLHFLSHLKDGGTAGFVMATGEFSNGEIARMEVRKALVEHDYVDCIVQLTNQLFANTQIPCSLWFLSRNRNGGRGYRKRTGEVLFIDGRNLGTLITGSRKQKELSADDIGRVAGLYNLFKRSGRPEAVLGFAAVADLDDIRAHTYTLTPGRYVGSALPDEEDGEFTDRFPQLMEELKRSLNAGDLARQNLDQALKRLGDG